MTGGSIPDGAQPLPDECDDGRDTGSRRRDGLESELGDNFRTSTLPDDGSTLEQDTGHEPETNERAGDEPIRARFFFRGHLSSESGVFMSRLSLDCGVTAFREF